MGMTLFLLLLGGIWTQGLIPEPTNITATLEMSAPGASSLSLVPTVSEAPNLNSVTPNPMTTMVSEKGNGTKPQIFPSTPDPYTASEVSFPEASTVATSDFQVSEPSNPEIDADSNPAEPRRNSLALHVMTNGTMATGSLETSDVAGGPPVTTATGSLEIFDVTGGPPVTMATGSLETSDVAGRLPVTMATGSLETSEVAGGPPVTMATGSLETSEVAGGPPVTMATGSLETSEVAGGPPVATATGSLTTPKGTSGSPISSVKKLTVTTSASSSENTSRTPLPDQGTKGTLLVAVLVALLVVTVLVVLLLLWRRRQKRRTGALTLSRPGKRNGVVDAWAGPAQMSDEEALTAPAAGSGGEKGSGASAGEGAARQPTLTTFLDGGKAPRCPLELEELKAGAGSLLKTEEEPLVGSEEEA
ncbi:leukosialin [Ailuropoda melanoleuca]|nr:leukosialin [Ailuropoda melanoleuca]